MNNQKPLLSQLIESLRCLPGVGNKSAQRMAYYLLDKDRQGALNLSHVLNESMRNIGNCQSCRDYTEEQFCRLCINPKRNDDILCVVESPSDIQAIESTASYSGKYFVLMGNLSPLDGIGPDEIGLNLLAERVSADCKEVIVATSSTVEGEATAHFIKSILMRLNPDIIISRLAQGVPIGGELEYLDSSTLSLSLANRNSI